jgi:hypothetical protein
MIPYLIIACSAYTEQVGEYLHALGSKGEIKNWYTLIRKMKGSL